MPSGRCVFLKNFESDSRSLPRFILVMVIAVVLFPGSLISSEGAQRVNTNRDRFAIPFQFDAQKLAQIRAREIQLFVSTDQGQHWEHQQSVMPSQRQFQFQAITDGEYWFSVKTLDYRGQLVPDAAHEASLIVIVDRQQPVIKLSLDQQDDGRITVTWKCHDDHLNVESLNLDFRSSTDAPWQTIRVQPMAAGKTRWKAEFLGQPEVRASIADMAGNQAKVTATKSSGQLHLAATDERSAMLTQAMMGTTSDYRARPVSESLVKSHSMNQMVDQRAGQLAESSGIRFVNSKTFQMEYLIDDVGPSGVGAVELFVSEDEGRQWWQYGIDQDRRSPFDVEVPSDGAYGFTFRIHSGVGFSQAPPQSGQRPEMKVVVDTQEPRVQLQEIKQGQGRLMNQIQIHWQASDSNLVKDPVTISYSGSRHGPWQRIVESHANTGVYQWDVTQPTPAQFFVKLSVRDAAGNEGEIVSEKPVMIDLARPKARVIAIDPVRISGHY